MSTIPKLRALGKTLSSRALHWTGIDEFNSIHGRSANMPVVVGYHRVVEDFTAEARRTIPANLISRQTFEHHLDWLGRKFDFISVDQLGAKIERREKFDRPAVAVTFDDGYGDIYYNALPVLKRKGIPAAIFVSTELIGQPQPFFHDKLYHLLHSLFTKCAHPSHCLSGLLGDLGISPVQTDLSRASKNDHFASMRVLLTTLSHVDLGLVLEALEDKLQTSADVLDGIKPLTWEMLRAMIPSGITIGSHTRTHTLLPNESRRTVQQETEGSRLELESKLGVDILHFSYPDGSFDSEAVQAVAGAGYRYAYTTCRHRDPKYPLLTIPRMILWENSCMDASGSFSPAIMSCQVSGMFDCLSGCKRVHGSLKSVEAKAARPRKVESTQ